MSTQSGRLTRLEERAPKGCPTYRAWGVADIRINVAGVESVPTRPERCPDCARDVPTSSAVISLVERPDGPA